MQIARGLANDEPTKLLAYDNFEQTPGNLEGKELPYPSATTWAETNKTGESGFKVFNLGGVKALERTKTSDTTLDSGCFAQVGATTYTTVSASVTVGTVTAMPEGLSRIGLLGRYVSVEKWVTAILCSAGTSVYLAVIKDVAGVVTSIGLPAATGATVGGSGGNRLQINQTINFFIAANGAWSAKCGAASLSGQDSALAAGGTLASGKCGLYDAYTSASAGARYLDSFQLLGAEEPARVCYSGKQIEFRSDGVLRQDSTGAYDGEPFNRGGSFYLDPAGSSGAINRVVARMRRNDVEEEADANVTDKHTMEIKVIERFLAPR